METCPLCHPQNETVLWHDRLCRVILVGDADYPGFCRVIWQLHVQEMTDLNARAREYFMHVVFTVEQVLHDLLKPDKINLASLGNQTPHLHWHVIPRFNDDAHFPDPVWAARKCAGHAHPVEVVALMEALRHKLNPDKTGSR